MVIFLYVIWISIDFENCVREDDFLNNDNFSLWEIGIIFIDFELKIIYVNLMLNI